jgi:hypothetical protein
VGLGREVLLTVCGAEAGMLGLGERETEMDAQTERKADDGVVMCKMG